jgi:outer membrane protein OmpA-like peptidoglycan-associated protein
LKSILTILLIIIGSFGLSSKEEANEHTVYVGTNFGLNLYGSDFKNLGNANTCCPGFTSGFSTGLNFGAGYNYLVGETTWIFLGLDYTNMKSNFIINESEQINLLGTNKEDATIEQKVVSELSSIGISLGAIFELFESFDASFGYRLGLPNDLSYRQTEILLAPSDGVFQESGSRTRTDVSGVLANSIYHSLVGKFAYRLYTSKNKTTYLNPNISFNIGLNSTNEEMNLTPNSINFGVDWAYNFAGASANEVALEKNIEPKLLEIVIDDTVTTNLAVNKTDTPKVIIRPVTIDKNDKRQDRNEVVIDEVKSIRMVPLLNYIFFDKDSTAMPIRYSTLNKKESYSFNSNNLFEVNTLDIYHHLLNIIGERMMANPKSKLNIVGTKSVNEIGDLAKILPIERAKTVRDYLTNTWGIAEKRLVISSIDKPTIPSTSSELESIEENQRVELYSSDDNLLEPLLLNDTLYTPITKEINFYTVLDTNVKDFSWNFKVFNDENSPYFEESGRLDPPLKTHFKITEDIAYQIKDKNELTYRFDLINAKEERENVTGRINVTINSLKKKERDKISDVRIDKYSLILFDFDKYELSKKNSEILDIVKDNITNNSSLEISGYSDKIGESDYNKTLSKKRTESVSAQFPNNKKELFPYGESIIIYNNNLPEGRFYSRTVTIKAITPVKK